MSEDTMLLKTFTEDVYPTMPNSVFACHPVALGGFKAEADDLVHTEDESTTVKAYNLGNAIPPEGTMLIAHRIKGRMYFRYEGP